MGLSRYAELRDELLRQTYPSVFAPAVLRDAGHNYVPIAISERLVQCIWYDQRLQPAPLQTADGRPVEIVFPGWWNLEAGPDFRNATVRLDGITTLTGDVEIHLRADDWFRHGHDGDPRYNNVILHVVLWGDANDRPTTTRAGDTIRQLVVQHQLAAPLETLSDEIELDSYPYGAGKHGRDCAHVVTSLSPATIQSLLDAAGDERFAVKTRRFARWIHRTGAAQACYEGWMEALGFKANKTPFRTLAQRLPLTELLANRADMGALLFGVANLLPTARSAARDAAGGLYLKRLWRGWWKRRPEFLERVLPPDFWKQTGIRPANHPQRRIGAAVALLKKHPDLLATMTGAVESGGDPLKVLLRLRDEFWQYHYTLSSRPQRDAIELIGENRAQEIVANAVLPCIAAVAEINDERDLAAKAKACYDALPAAPSNSVLRLVGQQLFGHSITAAADIKTARRQHGLLQIFQDFCLNDKSACAQCHFPELARRWTKRATKPPAAAQTTTLVTVS